MDNSFIQRARLLPMGSVVGLRFELDFRSLDWSRGHVLTIFVYELLGSCYKWLKEWNILKERTDV